MIPVDMLKNLRRYQIVPTSTAASTSCVTRSFSSPPAVSSSMAEKSSLQRTGSDGKEHEHKRTQLKHHNTWPTREPVSPRGPLKSHLAHQNNIDDTSDKHDMCITEIEDSEFILALQDNIDDLTPQQQAEALSSLEGECTCTYAVSKLWMSRWEEYVGKTPKGAEPGQSDPPGSVDMDTHNDANNDYLNEEKWKLLIRWYSISPNHQLDRKHLYFKDEKTFDVCILSPFSGIVEHTIKKFNRFEEIGYIECQMRKIFHVPIYKKTRIWISEKAQVPRFRQLLLRFRMLNDCIHRDKVYILALEECVGSESWPTGEPGEPKGDLSKYDDLVIGRKPTDAWELGIVESLDGLTQLVQDSLHQAVNTFLQNGKAGLMDRQQSIEKLQKSYQVKQKDMEGKEKILDDKILQVERSSEEANKEKQMAEQLKLEVEQQRKQYQEELVHMEKLHAIQESRVRLDIGGHTFTTSTQTLRRDTDSMLAAMFSGRHPLKQESDGSYFIDRDGTHFRYILNFLRDGTVDEGTLPSDVVTLKEILREAKYYQISELVTYMEKLALGKLNQNGHAAAAASNGN